MCLERPQDNAQTCQDCDAKRGHVGILPIRHISIVSKSTSRVPCLQRAHVQTHSVAALTFRAAQIFANNFLYTKHCMCCRTDDLDHEAPTWTRAAAVAVFAMAGAGVAWAAEVSLGDATWSVSTGLGACLSAAVYEVHPLTGLSFALAWRGPRCTFVCCSCETCVVGKSPTRRA